MVLRYELYNFMFDTARIGYENTYDIRARIDYENAYGKNAKIYLRVKHHAVVANEEKLRERDIREQIFKLDAVDLPPPLQARLLGQLLRQHHVQRAVQRQTGAPRRQDHGHAVNVEQASEQVNFQHRAWHVAARTRLLVGVAIVPEEPV